MEEYNRQEDGGVVPDVRGTVEAVIRESTSSSEKNILKRS
jgi:hypothetical protein